MNRFLTVGDIGDLNAAVKEAAEVKKTPFAWQHLGKNKTIILIFFNSSLRTRNFLLCFCTAGRRRVYLLYKKLTPDL